MASTLIWKVYRGTELVASTKYAEDAAAVVYLTGDGTVKWDGTIMWREGKEAFSAGDSYDQAAEIMYSRRREKARRKAAAYTSAIEAMQHD